MVECNAEDCARKGTKFCETCHGPYEDTGFTELKYYWPVWAAAKPPEMR